MDPLGLLERKDKWFLGGGTGALYAPPFPRWLRTPGFWDECFLADIRLDRLFSILFLGQNGRPLRLEAGDISWRPDRLVLEHRTDAASLRETRCVLEKPAFTSTIELLHGEPLHAFVWTLQDLLEPGPGTPWRSATDVQVRDDCILIAFETRWPDELIPDRTAFEVEKLDGSSRAANSITVWLAIGADAARGSFDVVPAQRHDDSPIHATSMLPDRWVRGSLGNRADFRGGTDGNGLLHALQQYTLEPGHKLTVACGVGLSATRAVANLQAALSEQPAVQSEGAWRRAFAGVPQLTSANPYLQSAYWYRWYGLRLNTVNLPDLPIEGRADRSFAPFVTEGIGFFRNFVTYSAQAHLREAAWMHDPSLSVGILDNLCRVQREDGSMPGHNYSCRPARDIYHSDFATGADRLNRIHPGSLKPEHINSLIRLAGYYHSEREVIIPDESACYGEMLVPTGVFEIHDQNETGQEYMNRYQFAHPGADSWATFRLAGVDVTTYLCQLNAFLDAQSPGWRAPNRPACGLGHLWNAQASIFSDRTAEAIEAMSDDYSPARPATGLYPLMLPDPPAPASGLEAMVERWLLNPAEFWLPKGFPAEAATEPTFNPGPEWKSKRVNCPWSGRSWPMANSHLVDGLASVARNHFPRFRPQAAEALLKAVSLLFHDGDPRRPNCFEHYDPITGVPCLYRGYDDYMHSWIVDAILRHAVGVLPEGGESGYDLPAGWKLDPLSITEDVSVEGIPHPESRLHVRLVGGKASWEIEPTPGV